jgi:hypothetical protein
VEPAAGESVESVESAGGESVESAGGECVEPEPIESGEANDLPIPDRELPAAPALPRRVPAPSRRAIALGSLLVAFVAVAIPVIRSILSEPRQSEAIERKADPRESMRRDSRESMRGDLREPTRGDLREPTQGDLREPTRGDLREPTQGDLREPTQGDLREPTQGDLREPTQGNLQESKRAGLGEPSEAIEPGGSVAREASGEIRAATRAAEPRIAEPPAVEPPSAETLGPLAVQINASPWANVEVDGIDLGVTPLANIPLFAGAHAFRVRMPDGRVIERTVEIDAERRFISFE